MNPEDLPYPFTKKLSAIKWDVWRSMFRFKYDGFTAAEIRLMLEEEDIYYNPRRIGCALTWFYENGFLDRDRSSGFGRYVYSFTHLFPRMEMS